MGYEVNGVTYDYYSSKNQQIADMIVNREVRCCVTSQMEYMIKCILDGVNTDDAPFTEEEIYNAIYSVRRCPNCGDYGEGFEEITPLDLYDSELDTSTTINFNGGENTETYLCPTCSEEYATPEEAKNCCPDSTFYRCCHCGKALDEEQYNDIDTEPAEVYEWWIVDSFLGDDLKKHGEVVLDDWGVSYWGRCTTGQSISIDWVILKIAYDHGWLEGQPNQWHV